MEVSLAHVHIFTVIDALFFVLGILLALTFSKNPPKWLVDMLHAFKVIAGAAILVMVLFKISMLDIIGTGIDVVLCFIGGTLLAAGILRTETNLL